jgi:hypothetical protein
MSILARRLQPLRQRNRFGDDAACRRFVRAALAEDLNRGLRGFTQMYGLIRIRGLLISSFRAYLPRFMSFVD